MGELISGLAAVILPVFLVSGIGYVWRRFSQPFDHEFVTRSITWVGAPATVFSALTRTRIASEDLLSMGGAMLACMLLSAAVGALALKWARLPWRVYLPSLIFPNVGNMGLPVCLFAFGDRGLALAMVAFAVCNVGQFTFGPAMAAGSFNLGRVARIPFLYAVAAAAVVCGLGLAVPRWLDNAVGLLSGLTIPLMLLGLGAALADFKVTALGRSLALSALRIGGGAAAGWGVATLFGLDGAARGVLVIQSAMPVAVFNFLFARLYDNRPDEVAGMVLASTALAFLTLPLVVAAVM